jgi:3-oxoacyl-[acyl-carrier protein] reductase
MTAIVTGASRGIGRALATELASRGLRIGLLARDRQTLGEVAEALAGDDHIILAADCTKRRELERAIERFAKRAEGIDILAANAGIAHYGRFAETEVELAEEMVKVNVLGTIYAVHAALPFMLERGRGHVVVTSSGAGLRAFPEAAVYGATKAADRGFAEALRHELAGTGVSVTTVYPGEVATDLHAHERDILPDWRSNDDELPPHEVAAAIVDAIEADRREVSVPKIVRLLGLNGVSPRLVDEILARIRGQSAAPRRG